MIRQVLPTGSRRWQAVAVDHLRELAVREAMFAYLDSLVAQSAEGNLTWEQTAEFPCSGETIVLCQTRGRGIHKPRQLDAALSITTAFTGFGREPRYRDSIGQDGYPRYKYEGDDPNLATNRALRSAIEFALPLTYFVGVRRGVYKPVYPVYVAGEDAAHQEFMLSFSRTEVGLDFSTLSAPEKGVRRQDDQATAPSALVSRAGPPRLCVELCRVPAATRRVARRRSHHR